jgi:hypothetical protein
VRAFRVTQCGIKPMPTIPRSQARWDRSLNCSPGPGPAPTSTISTDNERNIEAAACSPIMNPAPASVGAGSVMLMHSAGSLQSFLQHWSRFLSENTQCAV